MDFTITWTEEDSQGWRSEVTVNNNYLNVKLVMGPPEFCRKKDGKNKFWKI